MIDSYHFGTVVIDGKRYNSDVIIFPIHIESGWRRKKAHQLHLDDIKNIMEEKPQVLIIGTGSTGLLKVLPETQEYLKKQDVKLIAQSTNQACETYNRIFGSEKVIAALHLTC